MFCNKCGTQIPEDSQWCPKCGARISIVEADPAPTVANVQQTAPGAVSGFILSLSGFLLDVIPIAGLAMCIIGVILCSKGKKQVADNPSAYTGTGLLTAGEIIGIIGIICGAISIVVWIFWAAVLGGGTLVFLDMLRDMID